MKKIVGRQSGYAFVELMIVIGSFISVAIIILWIIAFLFGNFWYDHDGILKRIQFENPAATEIVDTERNIFAYSKIIVKVDNHTKTYLLDSNVLFNYEIVDPADE